MLYLHAETAKYNMMMTNLFMSKDIFSKIKGFRQGFPRFDNAIDIFQALFQAFIDFAQLLFLCDDSLSQQNLEYSPEQSKCK